VKETAAAESSNAMFVSPEALPDEPPQEPKPERTMDTDLKMKRKDSKPKTEEKEIEPPKQKTVSFILAD